MIKQGKGRRSVALEGEWGSGKTTVNQPTEIQAGKQRQVHDCSVRSRGLTRVIHFVARLSKPSRANLIHVKWIDEQNWNRRLDELAQKLEVKRTKTVPQITTWASRFGLSLFLIPIGLTFLTAALREDVTIRIGSPHPKFWIEFIIGALLSLSPLILY